MTKLLIDDDKDIEADKVIRNFFDGIRFLLLEDQKEKFDELLLDYYLDNGHTGLEILKECIWSEQRMEDNDEEKKFLLPNKITLVSSDKSCNKKMADFLIENGYEHDTGWSYIRKNTSNK